MRRRKSGLVVSKLDSSSKGCAFESRLIQNTRWKWLMSKPCQDQFLHPILVHFWKNKKNIGTNKIVAKKINNHSGQFHQHLMSKFETIFLRQKSSTLKCKYKEASRETFVQKSRP
jgi:hypothetical protein